MAPPPCETAGGWWADRAARHAPPEACPELPRPAPRPPCSAAAGGGGGGVCAQVRGAAARVCWGGHELVRGGCRLRGVAWVLPTRCPACSPRPPLPTAAAGRKSCRRRAAWAVCGRTVHGTGTATALIFSCTGPSRPPHRCSSSSHACVPPLHPPAAAPAGTPHGTALGAGDLDSQPRARARPHPGHPHAQHAAAACACPPAQQAAAGLLPPLCRDAADAAGGKQPACAGKPGQLKLGQLMGCRGPAVARDTAGPPAICMFDNSRPAHHSHRPSRRSSLLTCRFRRRRGRRAGQRPPARQGWARRPLLACWSVSGLTACPRTAAA